MAQVNATFLPQLHRENPQSDSAACVAVISDNLLVRSSLTRCLTLSAERYLVHEFDGVEAWAKSGCVATTVLYCAIGPRSGESYVELALEQITVSQPGTRTIVVSDHESSMLASRFLELGASGCVTTHLNIDIVIAAVALVRRGGIYIPANGLMAHQNVHQQRQDMQSRLQTLITPKQIDVLKLIRRGMSNKVIAKHLGLSEHTVKVHVRNIMHRLIVRIEPKS